MSTEKTSATVHVDDVEVSKQEGQTHFLTSEELVADAKQATSVEHQMSLWEGIRTYPKAVGWSVLISATLIMEGYDTCLIGSFYAFDAFQQKYGERIVQSDGSVIYQVPARWQTALSNGTCAGEIIGLFIAGLVADRIGYRYTLIGALIMVIGFIFIAFFSKNVEMLLAGEILCGIPWGVFQTLTVTFASDVTPTVLRSYLTAYNNCCWVIGQLLASGVLRAYDGRTDEWAYRIPFALQWMWPIPIMIGVFLAPESPWWLVRHGKIDEAIHSLKRLTSKSNTDFDAEKTVAMMVHTNAIEVEIQKGVTYWDLFKGVNLRRTEIAATVWAIQNLCGATLMGYSAYFYEKAGLDSKFAFDLSIIQYCLGIVGTLVSYAFMKYFGRRTLYLVGLVGLFILTLLIGILGIPSAEKHHGLSWGIGSLLVIFTFVYDSSIGPACYALVPEVASTRMRIKSTIFARNVYNVVGIVTGVLTPYMLTSWNWGAKTGFFWAGFCLLCLVWCYFRLPEPKGRTYGELDVLFEMKVPARKFSSTVVDQFEQHPVYHTEF